MQLFDFDFQNLIFNVDGTPIVDPLHWIYLYSGLGSPVVY